MHEFAICLDKAGFDADLVQKIISARNNKMAKAMLSAIGVVEPMDERFEIVKEFTLTVPENYTHDTQLALFAKDSKKKFYFYNDAITDKNFANATNKLTPGKTYTVKVIGIKATVTSEDCLTVLKQNNAILVGAQGAALAYQLKKDELPVGKWSVSFDEKDALWKDAVGNLRVPGVVRFSDGDWEFRLGYFGGDWFAAFCLLCFCD